MDVLMVVDNPQDWPLEIPGIEVVVAQSYLTDPSYGNERTLRVFNLCKSCRYQSLGYYVSLLAEARGHKPLPRANTLEDLQSQNLVQLLTADLDELIQRSLALIRSDEFVLSIYFGRNITSRYDTLSRQLFDLLQAPLLRAHFERVGERWRIRDVRPIDVDDIPHAHREFVVQAASSFFTVRRRAKKRTMPRYSLAILRDPDCDEPASDEKAIQKFEKAADSLAMQIEIIGRADFGRLSEFDALFIRDNTFVNHYTYRFSRRAAAEGLVVIDEPDSILKCNNKVYLAELMTRHNVPVPKTLTVHAGNVAQIVPALGLPCVLKEPDSALSLGVVKVESEADLLRRAEEFLGKSDLVIAQEWLATDFDWRVGVLDRRVLFVAKYMFPRGHWQIIQRDAQNRKLAEGATTALSVSEAPEELLRIALKAANLIGDGFYGVDLKQVGNRYYVMEVNDNPNVDAGNEDGVLKDALYREVLGVFVRRIEERRRHGTMR
jgi:glutathione synthase/RimK-type ligase-like ATP-grasp enzyme